MLLRNTAIILFAACFLSEILTAFSGIQATLAVCVLMGLLVVAALFRDTQRFEYGGIKVVGIYLFALACSAVMAQWNDIPLKNTVAQMSYYFKPLVFFMFGYLFLDRRGYDRMIGLIFWAMLLVTLLYVADPQLMIGLAALKLSAKGYVADGGFQQAFIPGYGHVTRNPGLLLGALESSFICLFLACYFFFFQKKRSSFPAGVVSALLILSTVTRSSALGLLAAVCVYGIVKARPLPRFILSAGLAILAVIIGLIKADSVMHYISVEGSASIHFENLFQSLRHLAVYPLGTGLGTSGWAAALSPYTLYSEGSLFTSLIENGILFGYFYVVLLVAAFVYSRDFLFPVAIGYLVAALLIPIGVSTHFNLLMFACLGILVREHTMPAKEAL